jgi:hypothetical protein
MDEALLQKISNPPRKSVNLVLKVNPQKLNFISMIIDGHGRIALPRTRAGKEGKLDLLVSPDCIEELMIILDDLKKNVDPSLEIIADLGDNWLEAVV